MGDLLIRNISDAMKRSLVARADKTGRSLSDEARDILQKGLIQPSDMQEKSEPSAWDVLRPILVSDNEAEANEYTRIMEDIEAERKKDFGRPSEDLE